jgi:hypothetical protein
MTVDEFVEAKVQPEYRDLVQELRRIIRAAAPQAEEVISYGIPMYKQRRTLAWINPSKSGITVGFTYGQRFEDRYQLLRGAAKHARNMRIRHPAELNQAALRYYLKQARALDKGQD